MDKANHTKTRTCHWTPDEDGIYDTDCGERFEFICGSPRGNKMKFCPYCGKTLIEKEKGE